jgi:endonuclease III
MPRESFSAKSARATQLLRGLEAAYPDAHCELVYSNPLELLVATILSAQCTDKQVNRVTQSLFQKYLSAQDYAESDPAQLERDLQQLGFFRTKAKNLRRCAQTLVDQHNGNVPTTMDALVQLAGVGRKTANVVLGNAFHCNVGVVVDTHVSRLAQRLGLTAHSNPVRIEQDLMKLVPQDDWTQVSHWLIWHGRRRCSARRPDCLHCELRTWCPRLGPMPAPVKTRPKAPNPRQSNRNVSPPAPAPPSHV